MPTKLKKAEEIDHEDIVKFSISCPSDLVAELNEYLYATDQVNRSSFIRRAIMAQLERERRQRRRDALESA